jgi:hypothetical protein
MASVSDTVREAQRRGFAIYPVEDGAVLIVHDGSAMPPWMRLRTALLVLITGRESAIRGLNANERRELAALLAGD